MEGSSQRGVNISQEGSWIEFLEREKGGCWCLIEQCTISKPSSNGLAVSEPVPDGTPVHQKTCAWGRGQRRQKSTLYTRVFAAAAELVLSDVHVIIHPSACVRGWVGGGLPQPSGQGPEDRAMGTRMDVLEERSGGGGGGIWDPKDCVPKMAPPDFPNDSHDGHCCRGVEVQARGGDYNRS